MKTLIKNGRIVTAVDDYRVGVLVTDRTADALGFYLIREMSKAVRGRLFVLLFVIFVALNGLDVRAQTDSAKLEKLAGDYWENVMASEPLYATELGDGRFDDKLADISEAGYRRRYAAAREFFRRAGQIRERTLSADERVSLKMLRRSLSLQIEGERLFMFGYDFYLMPMNQLGGFHLDFLGLPDIQPFATVKDYENYVARLRAFPKQADDAAASMRKGIRLGIVQPKAVVERIIPQLAAGFSEDVKTNPLYAPISKFPNSFSDADKRRLSRLIEDAIARDVEPAFRKLLDFVKNEYLPKSRLTLGFSALPNGREMYRYQLRVITTTELSPAEIHRLGLREMVKLNDERKKILRQMNFGGTIGEFYKKLDADKTLRWFDTAAVERDLREYLTFIETRLPQMFADIPPIKYEIKPFPAYRAASATSGAYAPPSPDGSRPPIFYYNANRIEIDGIRKWRVPRLAFHESLPGHQLQDTYARANKNLPAFRRFGINGSYAEGWAVYAERLADELGAYPDATARFYFLSNLASIYADLVIETGIHDLGWTREQAFQFAREQLQDSRTDEEIERNIARIAGLPVQKLTYGIGSLTILNLREQSRRELDSRFDIRAFHNVVLRGGSIPLDILGELVREWIARAKNAKQNNRSSR